ncbi:putative secreted protein (Por secretion system target) [Arcicella aurantiaca]|uniref:Putative secreted protein (Por secretion system target) n=1 Tax=Arcicella aurantiaca TaxID=591202 RepID=A0A316ED18_9BACT|nr:T9SS type A sorting domain-containing protein [Arcicella aurantiaca]PWK26593.1 putative secreted protein (Por secretion system target) [Arcicella aurantiaca]
MKHFFIALLLLGTYTQTFSQRFYSISFDQLPKNYQLYTRNSQNQAIVPINGKIEVGNWSYLSVVVKRNQKAFSYQRSYYQYDSTGKVGTFSLKPVINAELAEYDFEIYASQAGKDSVLMVARKNIVAGDAYLIYGQSNARAWEEVYEYKNEFCRTYGFGSYQQGYEWGFSNSGFTGGFDGEQFIVGEWGMRLQKNIVERYGIPTCVINASTSGANIKTLSDRNPQNPADINSHYGRLIYFAREAGIADNIKGLFYWQGETDAVQVPSLWKVYFDELYKFWLKDLPSVNKIYSFQLPLFGAGEYNDEVGELRDYMRQLGKIYPKITTYAPMGASGWNGWHFGLDGYMQIGDELGTIIGRDFYNQRKKIMSPNIQKIFFSSPNRTEITLAFEDGQQMVYPQDTILPNIGGGTGTYSLKDFFYVNKEWKRVASGKAEGNKIILKLKEPVPTNDTTIKYLPSIYPYSGGSFILHEAPWIYKGLFMKNTDGMRAFAFHHLKISPYQSFESLTLEQVSNEGKQVKLKWNSIANIKGYTLERFLTNDTTSIQLLINLGVNQNTFTDTSLTLGTNYTYRLKAYSDNNESNYANLKLKTSDNPYALIVEGNVNFYNSATIKWQTVTKPTSTIEFFNIERKTSLNSNWLPIGKVSGDNYSYKDTTLLPNTTYFYQISSSKSPIFSGQVSLKTPNILSTPTLQASVLYFNKIQLNWSSVPDATEYLIEKKINGLYKTLTQVSSKVQQLTDSLLLPSTLFAYRIKAIGNKTESSYKEVEITTPSLLTKTTMTSTIIYNNSIKLNWTAVTNAKSYKIERKATNEEFKTLGKYDNSVLELIEKDLKPNTTYTYRLKAFSDLSESETIEITVKTPDILTAPELSFENITHESIKINWKKITNASKYVLERQGQDDTSFQKILETDSLLNYTDSKLKRNSSYTYRMKATSAISASPLTTALTKTLSILGNQNEESKIFNIFPNPTQDKLNIVFYELFNGTVSLIDIAGRNYFEHKITKQQNLLLDVSSLKKGIYLVIISSNQELYSQKIIVE